MTTPQPRPRLLLVEDDALLRRTTARALRTAFDVTAVGSGEEALSSAFAGAFDAVLTDFHMPAMTGIQLLELLRLRDPRPRRVLTSATPVHGIEGYMAVGLVHVFLPKPFDVPAVLRAFAPANR